MEMCMPRYLAQAVTSSVQSVHQVVQRFRSVSRDAKWSDKKKSSRVYHPGKASHREHRFVEDALFQS